MRSLRDCQPSRTGTRALLLVLALGVLGVERVSAVNGTRATRHCSGIYWRTHRDGAQLCPSDHGLLADVSLRRLRWSSWGGPRADARGFKAHTVFPNGHLAYSLLPVTLRLTQPKRCADGVRIYGYVEMTEYTPSHRRTGTAGWAISCSGKTGSAGEG
jgi:hypothetical protein